MTDYLLICVVTYAISAILILNLFFSFPLKKVEIILVVYLVFLFWATSHSSGNL